MAPRLFPIALIALTAAAQVRISQSPGRISVEIDGKPYTALYIGPETAKPYLHPLRSASGKAVTRRWPMENVPGQSTDEVHQRALVFAHGDVNGLDFWDADQAHPGPQPTIRYLRTVSLDGGTARLLFDWLDPQGKALLREDRTMVFHPDPALRVIDFDITLTANEKVKFGDSKEGVFGIRLAPELEQSPRRDAPKMPRRSGHILSSAGLRDDAVWGTRADWVDDWGEIDGETVGVAVFDHPANPRHPTYWHARGYGLLAANIFGESFFTKDTSRDGSLTLEPGRSLRFRYRVVVHSGTPEQAGIAALYTRYAPSTATVKVDPARVVNRMRGGIGASWHAIQNPIQGAAGSAWGANPEPDDEARWQQLYRHAEWLGLDWCRVELEQRMYEPERGRFDWDNPEMRILYRILDWAEAKGIDVFLQQMWGNVAWNSYPEARDAPAKRVHSAPVSVDDFAEGLAALADHLKHYKCIRWLAINNEPGWDWSWWQGPNGQPVPITPAFRAVRAALDRRGIALPLSGPDWTDLPALEPARIDFDSSIGAYDIHSYYANFDGGKEKGYPLSQAEKRLADWTAWAHARGKPLFLSEVGTMSFGWGKSDPGPGTWRAGLKDASLVVRGLNAGVDGFNRWSFTNRGDLDGQWQLVDTWHRERNVLLPSAAPHAPVYFLWGLLSRFTALHSEVLATRVEGPLKAAALRSPRGNLTLIVVNEFPAAVQAVIPAGDFWRYRMAPGRDPEMDPVRASAAEEIPGESVTVYSTYKLAADAPGIMVEP